MFLQNVLHAKFYLFLFFGFEFKDTDNSTGHGSMCGYYAESKSPIDVQRQFRPQYG